MRSIDSTSRSSSGDVPHYADSVPQRGGSKVPPPVNADTIASREPRLLGELTKAYHDAPTRYKQYTKKDMKQVAQSSKIVLNNIPELMEGTDYDVIDAMIKKSSFSPGEVRNTELENACNLAMKHLRYVGLTNTDEIRIVQLARKG